MDTRASTWGRLLIATLVISLTGCDSGSDAGLVSEKRGKSPGPIKIGALLPLSGDSADSGVDMLNAAELAADEINADGGVLGRPVEIVPFDDGCDPQTGTAAARQLLGSDGTGLEHGVPDCRTRRSAGPRRGAVPGRSGRGQEARHPP